MKNIYELKLHEGTWDEAEKVFVYRVAAGWIYSIGSSHVFVPFDNRFEECAAQNTADLSATDSQQLKQAIALVEVSAVSFLGKKEDVDLMVICLRLLAQRACV